MNDISIDSVRAVPVRITGKRTGKASDGRVRIQHWSPRERAARALKFGAYCWAAAAFSVIFPLVHFVLVPGFALAGPIVAFFLWSKESVVLGGEGACPECGEVLQVARAPHRFPMTDLCTKCQSEVSIQALGAASGAASGNDPVSGQR